MKVAIVGAGVMGASVAYHAALSGADVVIFDGSHEGRATAAGAGIICPWTARIDRPHWYTLASGGAQYYPQLLQLLAEDGEADIGYRRVGALTVSDDLLLLDADEARVLERRAGAPEMGRISRLTPNEARKLFPPLNKSYAALHVSGAARLDGRRLRAALLAAARRRGAAFETGMAKLATRGERIIGVETIHATITADVIVLAGGVWASEELARVGIRLPIEAQRGQILHLRIANAETGPWPVVLPQSSHYMLTFDDSRVVVGATREDGSGLDYRVTALGQRELLECALTMAPGLANATVVETRIGFRPMSPDGAPLLGRVPGLEGLVIANGLGSSGLTIGPYAGKLVAEEALGVLRGFDLSAYAPLRQGGLE